MGRISLRIIPLLVFAVVATGAQAVDDVSEVRAEELKKWMDAGEVVVINPLSRIEFNDLHIEGSVSIPLSKLKGELPPDKDKRLVFYCLGRK
jgi:rhodanese-related sulfurtransferase